ncbi:hypothetical protein JTB14_034347 [Gonioctena quinquepunctata]|nr:hypothetical protein JTB14_034347 [Gonioctena quinquepunctata]
MANEQDAVKESEPELAVKADKTIKMKCRATRDCAVSVCVNCFGIYHNRCISKIKRVKSISENKIACCESSMVITENKDSDKFIIIQLEKDKLESENTYLKQLIHEVQDKNNILRINNSLLLDKIRYLEEAGNSHEKHVVKNVNTRRHQQSSYAEVLYSKNNPIPVIPPPTSNSLPVITSNVHQGSTDKSMTLPKTGSSLIGDVTNCTVTKHPRLESWRLTTTPMQNIHKTVKYSWNTKAINLTMNHTLVFLGDDEKAKPWEQMKNNKMSPTAALPEQKKGCGSNYTECPDRPPHRTS